MDRFLSVKAIVGVISQCQSEEETDHLGAVIPPCLI